MKGTNLHFAPSLSRKIFIFKLIKGRIAAAATIFFSYMQITLWNIHFTSNGLPWNCLNQDTFGNIRPKTTLVTGGLEKGLEFIKNSFIYSTRRTASFGKKGSTSVSQLGRRIWKIQTSIYYYGESIAGLQAKPSPLSMLFSFIFFDEMQARREGREGR